MMPLFGAHLSIAGGLYKAADSAVTLDCETLQIFSKNASQWKAKPLTDDEVSHFRKSVKAAKLKHVTAHDSYLINLAAPGDELHTKSVNAFVDELQRAELLGLDYLVTHPGAHVGSGEETGLKRIVSGLDEALHRTQGIHVRVLLETTAGMGTTLGHRFEQLAYLLKTVREPERINICLDTCHVFAAGYDISTEEGYQQTFNEFDRIVGLKQLKLFHVNDSEKALGSRVDRHAGIGLGKIGESAFQRLVQDKRFAKLPMILETPKEDQAGNAMDPVNLEKLRSYVRS